MRGGTSSSGLSVVLERRSARARCSAAGLAVTTCCPGAWTFRRAPAEDCCSVPRQGVMDCVAMMKLRAAETSNCVRVLFQK